jgi:hypothetical protein
LHLLDARESGKVAFFQLPSLPGLLKDTDFDAKLSVSETRLPFLVLPMFAFDPIVKR